MATYYHGSSEIQADGGLQTLYLMNPNYNLVGYSGTQQQQQQQQQQQPRPANMLFLNNTLNSPNISHALPPYQIQHLVGIPLPAPNLTIGSHDPGRQSIHEIPSVAQHDRNFRYNLWDHAGASGSQPNIPTAVPASNPCGEVTTQFEFCRQVVSPTQQQGLSLSLSQQQLAFWPLPTTNHDLPVRVASPRRGEAIRGSDGSSSPPSAVSNGISGIQSTILGSKYLQAAQQLLDEVVEVGKGFMATSMEKTEEKMKMKMKMKKESMPSSSDAPTSTAGGKCSSMKGGTELTTAEKQDLQMKKAKLITMLDEVEQRYRQYHHQMQIVATSFEQAAGMGSAKSYTALALKTISKQFRCLKDAISEQIKTTRKSLGEEECLGTNKGSSRLKFVDHQIQQQRALQQLGMMQHNAWRPERGLPKRAVSVLRAWLFEHFLNPYPKDSDKHLLAKQSGLTRSQVSNWFINARVRLWKPMVEEMYLEEFKDQEVQNGSGENTSKRGEPSKDSELKSSSSASTIQLDQMSDLLSKQENPVNCKASPTEISTSTITRSPIGGSSLQVQVGFSTMGPSNVEEILKKSSKKPRNDMESSPGTILSVGISDERFSSTENRQTRESYELIAGTSSRFGGYPMGEIGRFTPMGEPLTTGFHGNGVSLTLGLPHCENLSLSGTQQNYLPNSNIQFGGRHEMGGLEIHYDTIDTSEPNAHSNVGYQNFINIQNKKRFAAQLLHDFVA